MAIQNAERMDNEDIIGEGSFIEGKTNDEKGQVELTQSLEMDSNGANDEESDIMKMKVNPVKTVEALQASSCDGDHDIEDNASKPCGNETYLKTAEQDGCVDLGIDFVQKKIFSHEDSSNLYVKAGYPSSEKCNNDLVVDTGADIGKCETQSGESSLKSAKQTGNESPISDTNTKTFSRELDLPQSKFLAHNQNVEPNIYSCSDDNQIRRASLIPLTDESALMDTLAIDSQSKNNPIDSLRKVSSPVASPVINLGNKHYGTDSSCLYMSDYGQNCANGASTLFLSLPNDSMHSIASFLYPSDLVALSATSKLARKVCQPIFRTVRMHGFRCAVEIVSTWVSNLLCWIFVVSIKC